MATALESPAHHEDSSMDQDDVVYPCKGCGEILEEGKAFELAGNRWHIDCFRCHTCGTLLDSDANLLLLGDGSLICNNCTYSCSACGNKIEDLAILTGDQAFCAGCFRCRSCKRKIDNLRYARTSQGIFCMSCHESLMARRRKKAKGRSAAAPAAAAAAAAAASAAAAAAAAAPTSSVEKALPSLPPSAVHEGAFSPEAETPPSDSLAGTPRPRSPAQHVSHPKKAGHHHKRDASPPADDPRHDGATLPASTYRDDRSPIATPATDDGDPEQGFLPMAFDPNPAPRIPQLSRKRVPQSSDASPPVRADQTSRDYFTGKAANDRAHRDYLRDEHQTSSRSTSTERDLSRDPSQNPPAPPPIASLPRSSPHIAYQDKNRPQKRTASGQNTPGSVSHPTLSPVVSGAQERLERQKLHNIDVASFTHGAEAPFKLQDVPKERKNNSRNNSKANVNSPISVTPTDAAAKPEQLESDLSPLSRDSHGSGVNPFEDPKLTEISAAPAPTSVPPRHVDRPMRGDSLAATNLRSTSKRSTPDPTTPTFNHFRASASHERPRSTSPALPSFPVEQHAANHDNRPSELLSLPRLRDSFGAPPPRASSRPSIAAAKSIENDDFTAPRAPPPAPQAAEQRRLRDSTGTHHSLDLPSGGHTSPALRSAGLPKYSTDGTLSMEREMSRIMRGERFTEENDGPPSILRKVSNAVKHGRSSSDRGLQAKANPNGTINSAANSPITISSPIMTSPSAGETVESLRAQLRRAQQRIGELEADKVGLEERVTSSAEITQVNSELREKRTTMAFLDTQREIVVRELEAMTHHLQTVKDQHQPLDLPALKSDILHDFADALQKLKEQVGFQIEDLMRKRNELTDEITSLIQMKDKGFQEYESLSTKNSQLMEMNNQLLHSIQENFKANRGQHDRANGLGIYHPSGRVETPGSSDYRNLNVVPTDSDMPNLLQETDGEPATVLTTPQVINIRKGQPKKFNWRKGGERVAKGVTKGIKGAFATDKQALDPTQIGMPYAPMQQAVVGSEQSSAYSKQSLISDKQAAGFGFFGQKNGKAGQMGGMRENSSNNLIPAADPSTLFGSDLEARCEYENRIIPGIVTRCIAEVEARGMRVEGIYRKSGGSGQVKSVQAGFEKDPAHDVSDPDLEIHAVTSALKQYFRKLPVPLITYDVYEALLDAGGGGGASGTGSGAGLGAGAGVGAVAGAGAGAPPLDKDRQAIALRQAVAELPEHHRGCLEYLVRHLVRVMRLDKDNLMTPLNLAVVFAPTIMRPLSIEREMTDVLAQRAAVQALLEQHEAVFVDE